MKIFITGSTGFIGKHFTDMLIASLPQNARVVLLQRSPRSLLHPSVKIIQGQLEIVSSYQDEIADADYVFHIAANADVGSSKESVWEDYRSLEAMIAVLKSNQQLKRFVFLSTIGAFDRSPGDNLLKPISNSSQPNPLSEYGKVKLASEFLIEKSNIPYTIFRPSWVWGRGMRFSSHISFFNRLIEKKSLVGKLGFPGRASFVYVDDLAAGMLKIISDKESFKNRSYFVGTETAIISDVLLKLHLLNKSSSKLIPLAPFRLLKPLHHLLPLAFNFLFLDYLTCDETEYTTNFLHEKPTLLKDKLNLVAARDQYAVITGANGGIGKALAELLNDKYRLILIDKDVSSLSGFSDAIVLKMDLSNQDELISYLQNLKLNFRVGLLVNNAGVGFKENFVTSSLKKDLLTVNVNMAAPLILSHHFKEDLLFTEGTLVNIASSVGFFPLPHMSTYAASKSFILSWTQAVEEELRGKVNVITFSPSGTRTNFQTQAGVKDSADLITPEDMAGHIYDVIIKGKSAEVLVGLKSKVLRMMMKYLPRRFSLKLISKLFEGNR